VGLGLHHVTPGKDNQAGTLSFDGFGYDDDTPGGFVSGGDVLIDGNNLGGASGPNAAGTVSVNLAPIASGTAFDAFWTAYLEGTHLSLKNGITLPADGDFSDEAATVPALAVGDVAVAHWYEANNAIGYAIVSDTSITPSDEATITVSPQDVTVKEISPAEFTVSATGNGTVTVQWQVSASDAGWADITGATSTTYTISETEETDDGTQYRALVINEATDEGPRVITSRAATLTVSPVSVIPVIGTQPSNTDVVAGEDATFTVVMSPTSTFFSYQWYRKDAGSETWTSITDATTTTLTLEDVILDDDGTQVYVEITSKETGKETVVVDSNTATLTVNSAGAPTDVLVFTDTETAWVTFKAPTGINISKYQYDISGDTKDWIDVDSTSNIITISDLDDGDYTIKVRAYSDLIGAGKASETIEFTVGAATKPGATATVLNEVAAGGSTYADGIVTFSFDISVTYTGDEAANDLWLDLRNIDTSESVTAVKTNNSDGTISKVGDVWLWRDAALEKNDTATLTLTIEIEVE